MGILTISSLGILQQCRLEFQKQMVLFMFFQNNSRFGDKFKPTLNIEPTDTFEDELRITEAGFDLVLYHAPG